MPVRKHRSRIAVAACAAVVLALGTAGCGGSDGQDADARDIASIRVTGPRLVAVGDIACTADARTTGTTCRQSDTAALTRQLDPEVVAPLGDMQSPSGSLPDYRTSFDPVWLSLKARMRPTPGDHEYGAQDAEGYFDYFGKGAGPDGRGWYSYELGDWHVVSLNGNCGTVGCEEGSPQQEWLEQDLAEHESRCTLAYWHQPRFSSGRHGGDDAVAPLWRTLQDAGAELVLSGNDHVYERFAPQDADGEEDADGGVVQFVVGTGGERLDGFEDPQPNSVAREEGFGVLELTLGRDAYRWRFAPVRGSGADAGAARCH